MNYSTHPCDKFAITCEEYKAINTPACVVKHLLDNNWLNTSRREESPKLVENYANLCFTILHKIEHHMIAEWQTYGNCNQTIAQLSAFLAMLNESTLAINDHDYPNMIGAYLQQGIIGEDLFFAIIQDQSFSEIERAWVTRQKIQKILNSGDLKRILEIQDILNLEKFNNKNQTLSSLAKLARIAARCDQGQAPGPQM
jgi:hypothetical protein